MRPDLFRLGFVVILCGFAGLLAGNILAGLATGLVVCLVWQHRMLKYISKFLRNGNDQNPPDVPGIVNEIIREIDSLRAHHKQREEKLAGFLSRFEEATEAMPDAVIVMDTYGHVEWANEKASDYLGVRLPRDQGQRFSHIIRQPELLDYLADVDKDSASKSLVISSPADTEISLEIRITRYAESSLLLVAGNVTDIQRANRMRKDFIANASHELRTPITVISGYLEAVENEANDLLPEWRPRIKQMRSQTRRMQNLIEDLLKLSRLESSHSANLDTEVDVAELLSVIHSEAQTLSGKQGHIFSLETQPDLLVRGDYDSLYSAFSNIVFNAVQYTPSGGVIRIKWYRAATGACMEVSDSGEGIAAEHIHRVTERFYRVDKGRSREKGGTGLGLAIAKHVMVQHEAELDITSEPGRGTAVKCLIPEHRVVQLTRATQRAGL